jgi:hypothetical protein
VRDTQPGGSIGDETDLIGSFRTQAMIHGECKDAASAFPGPVCRNQKEGKRVPSSRDRDADRPRSKAA